MHISCGYSLWQSCLNALTFHNIPTVTTNMTLRSPTKMTTDKMTRHPPTLTLIVPPELGYGRTLQQTKIVYDQLLADRHAKLFQCLLNVKAEHDVKCNALFAKNKDQAIEYGVRAQEALNRLCTEYGDELTALRRDYQDKLNMMYGQLDKAREEQEKREHVAFHVYPRK